MPALTIPSRFCGPHPQRQRRLRLRTHRRVPRWPGDSHAAPAAAVGHAHGRRTGRRKLGPRPPRTHPDSRGSLLAGQSGAGDTRPSLHSGSLHGGWPRALLLRSGLPRLLCLRDGAQPGDGLRIFPGPVAGRPVWAAPWTPDASVTDGSGRVRPEVVWAALDCPSRGIAAAGPPTWARTMRSCSAG